MEAELLCIIITHYYPVHLPNRFLSHSNSRQQPLTYQLPAAATFSPLQGLECKTHNSRVPSSIPSYEYTHILPLRGILTK